MAVKRILVIEVITLQTAKVSARGRGRKRASLHNSRHDGPRYDGEEDEHDERVYSRHTRRVLGLIKLPCCNHRREWRTNWSPGPSKFPTTSFRRGQTRWPTKLVTTSWISRQSRLRLNAVWIILGTDTSRRLASDPDWKRPHGRCFRRWSW